MPRGATHIAGFVCIVRIEWDCLRVRAVSGGEVVGEIVLAAGAKWAPRVNEGSQRGQTC